MNDFTKEQKEIICAVTIITEMIYTFTLAMVVHNTIRYLIPMKIKKPLIVWFYIFVAGKIASALFYNLWIFYSDEFIESYIYLSIYLGNFLAESLCASVIILQWLHLTWSIMLLYDEITFKQRRCRMITTAIFLFIWSVISAAISFWSALNLLNDQWPLLIWCIMYTIAAFFLRKKMKFLEVRTFNTEIKSINT